MKWTAKHDVELCKEVVVSRLFETRKKSLERGKVWEAVAKTLEQHDHICFRVDQRAVRDRVRKLLQTIARKKEKKEMQVAFLQKQLSRMLYSKKFMLEKKLVMLLLLRLQLQKEEKIMQTKKQQKR